VRQMPSWPVLKIQTYLRCLTNWVLLRRRGQGDFKEFRTRFVQVFEKVYDCVEEKAKELDMTTEDLLQTKVEMVNKKAKVRHTGESLLLSRLLNIQNLKRKTKGMDVKLRGMVNYMNDKLKPYRPEVIPPTPAAVTDGVDVLPGNPDPPPASPAAVSSTKTTTGRAANTGLPTDKPAVAKPTQPTDSPAPAGPNLPPGPDLPPPPPPARSDSSSGSSAESEEVVGSSSQTKAVGRPQRKRTKVDRYQGDEEPPKKKAKKTDTRRDVVPRAHGQEPSKEVMKAVLEKMSVAELVGMFTDCAFSAKRELQSGSSDGRTEAGGKFEGAEGRSFMDDIGNAFPTWCCREVDYRGLTAETRKMQMYLRGRGRKPKHYLSGSTATARNVQRAGGILSCFGMPLEHRLHVYCFNDESMNRDVCAGLRTPMISAAMRMKEGTNIEDLRMELAEELNMQFEDLSSLDDRQVRIHAAQLDSASAVQYYASRAMEMKMKGFTILDGALSAEYGQGKIEFRRRLARSISCGML